MSNGNVVLLGGGKNHARAVQQEGNRIGRKSQRERETLTVFTPSQNLVVGEEMLEAILRTKLFW